jgi:hypothetical protein
LQSIRCFFHILPKNNKATQKPKKNQHEHHSTCQSTRKREKSTTKYTLKADITFFHLFSSQLISPFQLAIAQKSAFLFSFFQHQPKKKHITR